MQQPESAPREDEALVVLDVRDLHPRERHQTIFDRLAKMGPGETLRLVNDHDPIPLRYQLEAQYPGHYRWEAVEAGPERWAIDISSRAHVFDARPILAAGAEPFAAIMETAAKTGPDEILVIYAPFEPVPLQGVLGEQGFTHITDKIDDDTWRVIFIRR